VILTFTKQRFVYIVMCKVYI